MVVNRLQPIEVVQLGEILDGLAREGVAKRGYSCGLVVGQLAVAVGIPLLDTYFPDGGVAEADGLLAEVLRLNADDNLLPAVIAVAAAADALSVAGRQVGQIVVAVALSAPAPVDVVAQVAVVAVGHKSVTHLGIGTADIDGTARLHLVIHDAVPLVVAGHRRVVHIAYRLAIAEILGESLVGVMRLRSRRGVGVVHLGRHTAVEHQLGHGALLELGGRAVGVAHVVPVERRSGLDARHADTLRPRRVARNGRRRLSHRLLALVVQYLGHRRGHAARHRPATGIQRTEVVIG